MAGAMTIADAFTRIVDPDTPLGFRGYDGSTAGPADAPVVLEVRSPRALQYLATSPNELGLARAFVTGHLTVHGDLYTGLLTLLDQGVARVPLRDRVAVLRGLGPWVLRRPPAPAQEMSRGARPGRRHSPARDAAVISHHYDLSNPFYERLLGPSMTYSCAVFPREDATLEEAQAAKYDLIAGKLGLRPGMRLLDIGCGWGGMVMHAARHYGVHALGVTLSRRQAEWARRAIEDRGLGGQAEVRHMDYRDLPETGFDAVSSIGVSEHIGQRELPGYVRRLAAKLRPGGRILNQCITRPNGRMRTRPGRFIDRYVFPDGELVAPAVVVGALHDNGFEVRHVENLREHYARTLQAWGANLQRHWDAAVAEVGEPRARVWWLYLAASRVGFALNWIQLHQFLGVKVSPGGASGMPLRPTWDAVAPATEPSLPAAD